MIARRFAAYARAQEAVGKSRRHVFTKAVGDILLPTILFWYDDINSLGWPPGDSGQIERILRGLDAATHSALNRPFSFHSPAQLAAHYVRSNQLVRRYGIRSCVVTRQSLPG